MDSLKLHINDAVGLKRRNAGLKILPTILEVSLCLYPLAILHFYLQTPTGAFLLRWELGWINLCFQVFEGKKVSFKG